MLHSRPIGHAMLIIHFHLHTIERVAASVFSSFHNHFVGPYKQHWQRYNKLLRISSTQLGLLLLYYCLFFFSLSGDSCYTPNNIGVWIWKIMIVVATWETALLVSLTLVYHQVFSFYSQVEVWISAGFIELHHCPTSDWKWTQDWKKYFLYQSSVV